MMKTKIPHVEILNKTTREISVQPAKDFLNPKGTNFVLDKKFLRKPPKITSKKISDSMYAVLSENKKWKIVRVDN